MDKFIEPKLQLYLSYQALLNSEDQNVEEDFVSSEIGIEDIYDYNRVFIIGERGSGKSSLLHNIVNAAKNYGKFGVYISLENIGLNPEDYLSGLEEYLQTEYDGSDIVKSKNNIICLDDIDSVPFKNQTELFQFCQKFDKPDIYICADLDNLHLYEKSLSELESFKWIKILHPLTGLDIASIALSDKPSKTDFLNFSDYVLALSDFITNKKTIKPLTISIDAPWGGGKSTLMEMLDRNIKDKSEIKNQKFYTVWFNAWKYEKEEALWAALAINILETIKKQYNFFKRIGLWFKLNYFRLDKRLLSELFVSILSLFLLGSGLLLLSNWLFNLNLELISEYIASAGIIGGIYFVIRIGFEFYKKLTKTFNLKISQFVKKPDYEDRIGFIAQFENDFKKIIKTVTKDGTVPLIIFIDDLDRCTSTKSAEIVEAINFLTNSEHCIFIIGMDSKNVAASIESKYKNMHEYLEKHNYSNEDIRLGHRFLEKIIQINFKIPQIEPMLMKNFIENILETDLKVKEKQQKEAIINFIKKRRQRDLRWNWLTYILEKIRLTSPKKDRDGNDKISEKDVNRVEQEFFAENFDDSQETKDAINNAAAYLGYNPRKIKRFVNNFRLKALIANRRGLIINNSVTLPLLAKGVIISTRWPDIHEWLVSDSTALSDINKAIKTKNKIRRTNDDSTKEKLESEFERYLMNPHINSCLENDEFLSVLKGIRVNQFKKFQNCIFLTDMTS